MRPCALLRPTWWTGGDGLPRTPLFQLLVVGRVSPCLPIERGGCVRRNSPPTIQRGSRMFGGDDGAGVCACYIASLEDPAVPEPEVRVRSGPHCRLCRAS